FRIAGRRVVFGGLGLALRAIGFAGHIVLGPCRVGVFSVASGRLSLFVARCLALLGTRIVVGRFFFALRVGVLFGLALIFRFRVGFATTRFARLGVFRFRFRMARLTAIALWLLVVG